MNSQVILVTGASSGIGKESAKLLGQSGNIVYGAARRSDRMEGLKVCGVKLLEMDVTNEASMVKGIEQILANEKRLDVLVNNAGYGSYGALEDVPISEAKYQFDVNVFGLARLTQLVLPAMRKQKSGKIINISSIGGKFGEPLGAWYHATKFAVEGLSDCLRMELKDFGIDVIIVEPGLIDSEWSSISLNKLIKSSGSSVYKPLAEKYVAMQTKVYKRASDPLVIAKTIEKAINSQRPKTRYAAGYGAKLFLFMRKIFSDKMIDQLMKMQLG